MLDFGNDPGKRKAPAFSLDKRDIRAARAKPGLNKVEWRLVLFMPLMIAVLGWTIWDWRSKIAALHEGAFEPIPPMAPLLPMAKPVLDGLPPLPGEADLAEAQPGAATAVAAGQPPPLLATGLDAATIAWAKARLAADAATPPLPTRLAARDLVLGDHVRIGTALIVEGRLDDRTPAPIPGEERPWQRLLLVLEEGQYAEVLAGPASADLVLGRQVRVVGRLAGYDDLPVAAAPQAAAAPRPQQVPLLLGRVVHELERPSGEDPLAAYHRPWSLPDDLWSEVDDERLWTETRPYYHLLGQVLRDRTTPGAWDGIPDGNQAADDIHLHPAEFRGKPFQVTGYVYHAWEDTDVAHDQPFGVARVVRVLLWRRDISPVTETVNGVAKRSLKQVLRLYEIAAVSDQPLPEHGEMLSAHGRFFKFRAIPVQMDPQRDRLNNVQRQSDRVYPWLFVTDGWEDLGGPGRYNFAPVAWAVSALITLGIVIGIVWWWREVRGLGPHDVPPWERRRRAREGVQGGKQSTATSGQRPAASDQSPATSGQPPATGGQPPAAGGPEPPAPPPPA